MSMSENVEKKGNFVGLVPLILFLVIYFVMGIGSGSFDNFPLMIGMFVAAAISLVISVPVDGKKATFEEKIDIFCHGGGDSTLILMVVIYMLAGGFYGVAGAMHATDSVTNLMLSVIPGNLVLPGLFLIGCVLSFAMGTSMGTISTLLPIGLGLADGIGVSYALVCGTVVGGAMFGDNLSFISDTTIAATTTQNCEMKDKFRANALMVLPAVILTVIILGFIPVNVEQVNEAGTWNFVNLLPYIVIIVLSLLGLNVVKAMSISIVLGVIIGILHGDFSFVECFVVVHDGMTSMQDMAVICVIVGGVIGLMKYYGGIDWLLARIGKHAKTRVRAELSIALLVTLVDIATTNNTMAIIACGPIAKEISDKYDIPGPRTASILDLYSCAGNGITPYAGQLLVSGGLAGVSPIAIMPYVFYSWFMFIFATIFIVIGFPRKYGATKTEPVKA